MYTFAEIKNFLNSNAGNDLIARWYGKQKMQSEITRWINLANNFVKNFSSLNMTFISSPGRVELGGNHTDHNNGRVLCAAVNIDTLACISPRFDNIVELISEGWTEKLVVDLSNLEPVPSEIETTNALLRGVAAIMKEHGYKAGGFSGYMTSDVPVGSGLSSSASVEVLFAQVQNCLYNDGQIPADEIAIIAQKAENIFFGKPCGLMDQMAIALGGISFINFAHKPTWEKINFDFEKNGYVLTVVNAGGSHADLTEEYAAIPREMKAVASMFSLPDLRKLALADLVRKSSEVRSKYGDRAFLRAFHFITENERVTKMLKALQKDKFKKYLKLVKKSGYSSWHFLQNVVSLGSTTEQSLAVALALAKHFLGKQGVARVHGGGFAGTIQAYVKADMADAFVDFMDTHFGNGATKLLSIRHDGVSELVI